MLFLVPDDPPENSPDQNAQAENEQNQDGTKLDDGTGDQPDRGREKVELDLDDAPFLDEEEEEEDSGKKEEGEEEPKKTGKEDKHPGSTKKWWLIGGLAVLFIIVAVSLFFFFGGKEPRPPKKPETKKEKKVEQPQKEPQESIAFEKFQVPHETENGTVFLTCRFTMATDSSKLAWEINRKRTVLRDAMFYYLKKKDLTFLRDKQNADNLKKDLLSVINQYLSNGELSELLIEEYFIK
jgi:flagellar FliL protein